MWISNAATWIMNNRLLQESIFEKLKSKNLTSFVVNGGAIYTKLFLNVTRWVVTEGGNIKDFTLSDGLGTELLLETMKKNEFDSYFIHFIGIDHAGHNDAYHNISLYEMTVKSIDDKLRQILEFAKTNDEKYSVFIFSDHG